MTSLGIDYGDKRIGLAITDELEIISSPLKTIPNDGKTIGEIRQIITERKVDTVVVGMPLNMDGTLGLAARKSQEFARKLKAEVAAEVKTFDERLTTVQADRAMLMHDVSRAKRAKHRDEMAAQILLQSYVDSKKTRKA